MTLGGLEFGMVSCKIRWLEYVSCKSSSKWEVDLDALWRRVLSISVLNFSEWLVSEGWEVFLASRFGKELGRV